MGRRRSRRHAAAVRKKNAREAISCAWCDEVIPKGSVSLIVDYGQEMRLMGPEESDRTYCSLACAREGHGSYCLLEAERRAQRRAFEAEERNQIFDPWILQYMRSPAKE